MHSCRTGKAATVSRAVSQTDSRATAKSMAQETDVCPCLGLWFSKYKPLVATPFRTTQASQAHAADAICAGCVGLHVTNPPPPLHSRYTQAIQEYSAGAMRWVSQRCGFPPVSSSRCVSRGLAYVNLCLNELATHRPSRSALPTPCAGYLPVVKPWHTRLLKCVFPGAWLV